MLGRAVLRQAQYLVVGFTVNISGALAARACSFLGVMAIGENHYVGPSRHAQECGVVQRHLPAADFGQLVAVAVRAIWRERPNPAATSASPSRQNRERGTGIAKESSQEARGLGRET